MKKIAAIAGCLVLIGMVCLSVAQVEPAGAQAPEGEALLATQVAGTPCGHEYEGCPGHADKCEGSCKDGKGCEGCQQCEHCKDCKDFKDADGDGKCDSAGQCDQHSEKKGSCHEKSACPHQKSPHGGCKHAKR